MKKYLILVLLALTTLAVHSAKPKREFRGAWIQCVNGQFQGMSTTAMQQTLNTQLDQLQSMGVNAVIFQVRPECDALYASAIEPWSRFLTGRQGQAPSPYWDPLAWMIAQCHARGMELHAWINPFRAKTKTTTELSPRHVAQLCPDYCFRYDDLLILNPGLQECRDYICKVVEDIVSRYDIDGLHLDDYFYPYPVAGQKIDDDQTYALHSNGIRDRGDWRRHNVNLFIKQLYETVHKTKPWVKVGISPFGIYRNQRSSAIGSATNGLQNYDDLYADVLLWVNNGWMDYLVPQIYWEIGNKAADYETLIRWWNQYASSRPLYIGEDVLRTVAAADASRPGAHQQEAKHLLHRSLPGVKGTVLWYAKAAVDNPGGYADRLRSAHWRYPALQPSMPHLDKQAPRRVKSVKGVWTADGYVLCWTAPRGKGWKDKAVQYVVYRFAKGEPTDLEDAAHIVAVTSQPFLRLPYEKGKTRYTYVVTALNRIHNESRPRKKKIKL